jgi:hypothetical protein
MVSQGLHIEPLEQQWRTQPWRTSKEHACVVGCMQQFCSPTAQLLLCISRWPVQSLVFLQLTCC